MNPITHLKSFFQSKALVLMYHRIGTMENDPWQLAVTPENFEEQLSILKKNYNIISVSQLITDIANQSIRTKSVCITFDDGYADNYGIAKPLLEKYNCSATFFIPTHYSNSEKLFWWDELSEIIFSSPALPSTLSISIDNNLFFYELANNKLSGVELKKQKTWAWPDEPPTQRCQLYLAIWQRLKPLPYAEIEKVIKTLTAWAGFDTKENMAGFAMSFQQLKEIDNHPLFELGLHTVTHPSLPHHSFTIQEAEILNNKSDLEKISNKVVSVIAYPYGDYNDDTLIIAKQNSIAGFTTQATTINKNSSLYQLGRFQVNNWEGIYFKKQLLKWMK